MQKSFKKMCSNNETIFHGSEANLPPLEKSFGHFILKCLAKDRNDLFQIHADSDTKMTRDDLRVFSIRCAIQLQQWGLKRGDILVECMGHEKYAAIPFVATTYLGMTINFLNDEISLSDHEKMIDLLQPKLILCEPKMMKNYANILAKLKMAAKLIEYTDETFEKLFLKPSPNEIHFEPEEVDISTTFSLILSSSGTTGATKGVTLTHDALYKATIKNKRIIKKHDVVFCYVGLAWDIGVMIILDCIVLNVVRLSAKLPKESEFTSVTAKYFEKYKVTYYIAIPSELYFLINDENFEQYKAFQNVRVIWCCGQTVFKRQFDKFRIGFPSSHIVNAYGSTEFLNILTYVDESNFHTNVLKSSTIGKLLPGHSAKIVDISTGKKLDRNEKGVLHILVDSMTTGYYKNREATQAAFIDGWYNTGDIAYVDEDDFWFVVGRSKDIFKYDTFQVVPEIIEGIINQYPGVRRSCVLGIPNDVHGELPMALVQVKVGYKLEPEEIVKHVEEHCLFYQRLHGGVRFLDNFPLTPSGKIKRYELQKWITSGTVFL